MDNTANIDISIAKYSDLYRQKARAWFSSGGRGSNWRDRNAVYRAAYDELGWYEGANIIPAIKRAMDAVDCELCGEPVDWKVIAREAREVNSDL
jgi:hypothetical protein